MIKELAKGTAEPLVLKVLSEGPQHGYAILQTIRERSDDLLDFTEGTIYPLLHNLESEGLVSSEWQTLPSGRRRKVYRITPAGARRLSEAAQQWSHFRAAVDSILRYGQVMPDHV